MPAASQLSKSPGRREVLRRVLARASWLVAAALSFLGTVAGLWLSLTTGFFWLWVLGVPWMVVSLLVGIALILLDHSNGLSKLRRCVLLSFALPLSILASDWPFRLALALSQPAMREVAATRQVDGPERSGFLGVFPVRRVAAHGDAVAFWTDLEAGGYSGLIYSPSGRPPFVVASEQALGNGWYFIVEE